MVLRRIIEEIWSKETSQVAVVRVSKRNKWG
jgi:hypothetical protein